MPYIIPLIYGALALLFCSRIFNPISNWTGHGVLEGDPALMNWVIQWGSHSLVTDPTQFFHGNTFFPFPYAVAYTEPMVPLAIANLPFYALFDSPWVGYNFLLLASYFSAAMIGYWFALWLTGSRLAGFWGGIFWGFLFFRFHHFGHIHIVWFGLMPTSFYFLYQSLENIRWRYFLGLMLSLLLVTTISWNLGVITALGLAVVFPLMFKWTHHRPVVLLRLGAVASLFLILLAPVILPYTYTFEHGLEQRLDLFSTVGDQVKLKDYLVPPLATFLGSKVPDNPYWVWEENSLYIGYTALLLCLGLLLSNPRHPFPERRRRWLLVGWVLVAVGYYLSHGYSMGGVKTPLGYFADAFPFIGAVRATQRYSLLLYFGILVLSSLGVQQILASMRSNRGAPLVALVATLFLWEVFPVHTPLNPDAEYQPSAADRYLQEHFAGSDRTIVHLPVHISPHFQENKYMIDSVYHWLPIVNGASGALPQNFHEHMRTMNTFPSPEALTLMRDWRINTVVLHRGFAEDRLADLMPVAIRRIPNSSDTIVLLDQPLDSFDNAQLDQSDSSLK